MGKIEQVSLRRRKSTVAPETYEATAEEHRDGQAARGGANCGCRLTPYELGRAMLSAITLDSTSVMALPRRPLV